MKLFMKGFTMRHVGGSLIVFWFLAGMAVAGNQEALTAGDNLSLSGTLEFDVGEFLKARTSRGGGSSAPSEAITVDHIWFGNAIATLNLASKPNDFFTVKSSFEFRQYSTMLPLTPGATRDPYFGTTYWNGFFIREGQGVFSLFNNESITTELAFGYMPYKYNPDVRNLGEFLFRSGTYPLFLINEFERPFARLLGLKSSTALDLDFLKVKTDLFGLVEHEIKPFNDVSLAAVGSINVMNCLEIGGGIDLAHFIPVDSRFTTLKEEQNSYFYDSVPVVTISDTSWSKDTGYYTYQGTKLMARASFDFLGLLLFAGIDCGEGSLVNEIFGPVGGKIYGEYAIIGLEKFPGGKNNPRGYMNVDERSPVMGGFTIPFWKILDVCAVEIERFPSYFPDSYWRPVINGYALPVKPIENSQYDSTAYKPRWNWSLYLKKQVTEHFGLVLKVGRDHQRWEMHPAQYPYYDFEAAMVKPDEWGWQGATVFSF
jgi:hypothetical protein